MKRAERVPFFLAFTSNNDEAGESNRSGHETKRGSERLIPALRSRGKNEKPSDATLHRRGSPSSRYRSAPRAGRSRLPATSGKGGGKEHDDNGDDDSTFDMMEPGASTGGRGGGGRRRPQRGRLCTLPPTTAYDESRTGETKVTGEPATATKG